MNTLFSVSRRGALSLLCAVASAGAALPLLAQARWLHADAGHEFGPGPLFKECNIRPEG